MRELRHHPLYEHTSEELHARPFAPMRAPAHILYMAFAFEDAANHDAREDLAHLNTLLAHLGAPKLDASPESPPRFHMAETGDLTLKWERHTEFLSIMLIEPGAPAEPFALSLADRIPQHWLDTAPGPVVSAALIHMEYAATEEDARAVAQRLSGSFHPASLACAAVTDAEAQVYSDFRLDPNGYVRFALIAGDEIGPRRLGRIAQRLLEIEVYRTLAMLALPPARNLGPQLDDIDRTLSATTQEIARPIDATWTAAHREAAERDLLERLTQLAARLEAMKAETAYRFSAARAYDAIIWERLDALREERLSNRQTLREFMIRRFKPSMRSCAAAEERLGALSQRVRAAAELLRTRVNVALTAQNQKLLESMDRRARLQLRLQETVEGLSVIAISYYAVSIAAYALIPVGAAQGIDAKTVKAALVLPVLLLVWFLIRRIRDRLGSDD